MKNSRVHVAMTMAAVASAFALTYAASAANIGYVGGLTDGALDKPFDLGWSARLASQGHTVTPIDQTTPASSPSLAAMDLLIVSQDVGSGTFLSNIGLDLDIPILSYEYGIYDEVFGASNGQTSGIASNGITIVDPLHPLSAGLSGNVSIYTGGENISRFAVSGVSLDTDVIAHSASDPTIGVFAVLEPGAIGGGGNSWSALRMALPTHDSWDPSLVTTDGWMLLDGAITYALIPEPSSFALLGLGVAFVLARRRRRQEHTR